MADFWTLYEDYENHRLITTSARNRYRMVLRELEEFAGTDFLHVSQKTAFRYRDSLNTRGFDDSTKDGRLRILKSVGTYCENMISGYMSPYTALRFFTETSHYEGTDVPTLDSVSAMLAVAEETGNHRAFLAMTLALKLCLSLSEITSIRRGSFLRTKEGLFLQVGGHDFRRRTLPVPQDVEKIIEQLFPEFFSQSSTYPLFVKSNGEPASARTIYRSMEPVQKEFDVTVTLQQIRLLGIYLLLQSKNDRNDVASFSGIGDRWIFRFEKLLDKPIILKNMPNIRIMLENHPE